MFASLFNIWLNTFKVKPIEKEDSYLPFLRARQINATLDVRPVLVLASVAAVIMLGIETVMTRDGPTFLFWATGMLALQVFYLRIYFSMRRQVRARTMGPDAEQRIILLTLPLGILWALMPVLLLTNVAGEVRTHIVAIMISYMCVTGFVLSIMPKATLSFLLPTLISGIWVGFDVFDGIYAYDFAAMIIGCQAIIWYVSTNRSRDFIVSFKSQNTIRSQDRIIRLLLKEFEVTSSDWLWEFDEEGLIHNVSNRFSKAVNNSIEIEGMDFIEFVGRISPTEFDAVEQIEAAVQLKMPFKSIELAATIDGEECWWSITGQPVYNEVGVYEGFIGTASDITKAKLAERRIAFLAHYDPLTQLANRTKFTEHLNNCINGAKNDDVPFSVLYLDLDHFKPVNDTHGHLIGDQLLKDVSRRIESLLDTNDLAARLGGDEFAIIIHNCSDRERVRKLGEELIAAVTQTYFLDCGPICIGVSIGAAIAPEDGIEDDVILRNADVALYDAKAAGRAQICFYRADNFKHSSTPNIMERELNSAVDRNEFSLHFQPLMNAKSDKAAGFEALVRWQHPERGLMGPNDFIPIAEQSKIIDRIGNWTIFEACSRAAGWPNDLPVSVNVSARHFLSCDISAVVRKALDVSGLDARRLELEITESVMLENHEECIRKLYQLKTMGVSIALDDFGTGYSSLSYLLKFPFDRIKIDASFIAAATSSDTARNILETIADLGKALHVGVTAEGVETFEQAELLRALSCDQLQGFFFAKPLDQAALASYFLNNKSHEMGIDLSRESQIKILKPELILPKENEVPPKWLKSANQK